MTGAHLHLALNHVPLVLLAVAAVMLWYALARRSVDLTRGALVLIVLSMLFGAGAYLTGEPAEHAIEQLPGFSMEAVEAHEQFAPYAAGATTLAGLLALFGLVKWRPDGSGQWIPVSTLVVALAAALVLAWTSYLGGQISHPELRGTPAAGRQVEIKVLSGNGARSAVAELCAEFERLTGHTVTVDFAVNPQVQQRIESGESFDVAVLNPPVLDALIAQGKVVGSTRSVIGRAGIGVAARAGAPAPDISTVAAFTNTLLNAESVAYPGEGASGKYFVTVVDRLGITSQMAPKMRPMPAEYNVEVVGTGEVELVVVVASRIAGVPGVQLVGLIPQELQTWIGFTGGMSAAAREPEAARALLNFLTSQSAVSALEKAGIQPFKE